MLLTIRIGDCLLGHHSWGLEHAQLSTGHHTTMCVSIRPRCIRVCSEQSLSSKFRTKKCYWWKCGDALQHRIWRTCVWVPRQSQSLPTVAVSATEGRVESTDKVTPRRLFLGPPYDTRTAPTTDRKLTAPANTSYSISSIVIESLVLGRISPPVSWLESRKRRPDDGCSLCIRKSLFAVK